MTDNTLTPTPPSEIISGVWIGDMFAASNSEFFNKYNIQSVLNCTEEIPNYFSQYPQIEYMRIPVNDVLQSIDSIKMQQYLPHAVSFIYKNHDLDGKNILIHCHRGIQRSATCFVGYLCKTRPVKLVDAINFVVSKRNIAFFGGHQINFIEALEGCCKK